MMSKYPVTSSKLPVVTKSTLEPPNFLTSSPTLLTVPFPNTTLVCR
ncbi:MAG: hypothetical protein QXD36_06380 [Sulfolobales archaeon]